MVTRASPNIKKTTKGVSVGMSCVSCVLHVCVFVRVRVTITYLWFWFLIKEHKQRMENKSWWSWIVKFCSNWLWTWALLLHAQHIHLFSFSFCVCLYHICVCSFLAWRKPLSLPLSFCASCLDDKSCSRWSICCSPSLFSCLLHLYFNSSNLLLLGRKRKKKSHRMMHPRKLIRFVA